MSSAKRNKQIGEDLLKAAKKGFRNKIERYLKRGANINYQNRNGKTALHLAASVSYGNTDSVQLLIDGGIDLNLQDKDGLTALNHAIDKGNKDILFLLIDNGIDINIQDVVGSSVLYHAARKLDTEMFRLLIDIGIDINLQDKNGKSALHLAALNGNTEIVKFLIDAGIDLNLQEQNGETVLHHAVLNRKTEIIKMLIEAGIDLNAHGKAGNTVLHHAAERDELMVKYLLNRNDCNPNILNNEWIGKQVLQLILIPFHFAGKKAIKSSKERCHSKVINGLPVEVKKFDKRSAQVFSSLLEEESYPHFESRVMLVGEQGTGKTTIARYLVGKEATKIRLSTDGIELYNGLSFMDVENHYWFDGPQAFSMEDLTLSRSLLQNKTPKERQLMDHDKTQISQTTKDKGSISLSIGAAEASTNETTHTDLHDIDDSFGVGKRGRSPPTSQSKSSILVDDCKFSDDTDKGIEKNIQELPSLQENIMFTIDKLANVVQSDTSNKVRNCVDLDSGSTGNMHLETVTKPGLIRKLKNYFGVSKKVKEVNLSITKESFLEKSSEVASKLLHTKKIAPIVIWDFGGQDVFYSTHQTFLTYRAIYMIVLDGRRRLDDPCPTEQYLPGKSGPKTAKDYLLFWINTIVTYCKGSVEGYPKIMIVLTHKDKFKITEIAQRRKELFSEIKNMFEKTPFKQHLLIDDKVFVNAKNKKDPEMAKIKDIIISETECQPTWGEPLPKCFIPLELECASLIKRNIHLITLEQLQQINSQQPIRPLTESELKVFLKFQHSIGKVLYFDEHKLNDRIILSPTLLIDAFKSIVTDRRFCKGDTEREELWDVMGKTGMVSKKGIQTVWKRKKYLNFYENKDYLLDVMGYLDILVEPKRYNSNNTRIPAEFYYVASMVRAKDDSGYLQSVSFTHRSISIAFQSSSLMIPPALSFRFLSYCLYVWAVKSYGKTNKEMLFHRSGVFTIDPSLDMSITCKDDKIIARLVHATSSTLIMRDLASSIYECLTSAIEKISRLYIRTSSDHTQTSNASFMTRICCNSSDNPCFLSDNDRDNPDKVWTCPSHGIEHSIYTITSWIAVKNEEECKAGCPVTNEEFLKATPSDLHLRRLSLLYSSFEAHELAIYLGLPNSAVETILETEDPKTSSFEILRQCRDSKVVTFKDIREALEKNEKKSIHTLCKAKDDPRIEYLSRILPNF
ncbi:uncharacterized protein [Mytilus edulis]|uniref:uncharacterized protein n=1 Tax=Mytilus edulis TaxID=6550 RepID=UPI0039EF2536